MHFELALTELKRTRTKKYEHLKSARKLLVEPFFSLFLSLDLFDLLRGNLFQLYRLIIQRCFYLNESHISLAIDG